MTAAADFAPLPFVDPDWNAPLDVDGAIARCPEAALMKGMMSQSLVELVAERRQTIPGARSRYLPFQELPLREHMAHMRDAGALVWPEASVRTRFRRFGRGALTTLLSTPYGRITLGKEQMTPHESLERLARAYGVVLGFDVTAHAAREQGLDVTYLHLRDVWYFLDSCHVGVIEGMLHEPMVEKRGRALRVQFHLFDEHNGVFRVA
jgi:hypothetical protein